MLAALFSRSWPGNVRELKNFIERSISLGWPASAPGTAPDDARGPTSILPEGTDALVPVHLPMKEAKLAWMDAFEGAYVQALAAEDGRQRDPARRRSRGSAGASSRCWRRGRGRAARAIRNKEPWKRAALVCSLDAAAPAFADEARGVEAYQRGSQLLKGRKPAERSAARRRRCASCRGRTPSS